MSSERASNVCYVKGCGGIVPKGQVWGCPKHPELDNEPEPEDPE